MNDWLMSAGESDENDGDIYTMEEMGGTGMWFNEWVVYTSVDLFG